MIEPPSSQRSATRAPIDRPIRLQFDDSLDVDEGQCINISIGGMFVHTDAPRPPGTLVRFELPLSDELSIRGLGEVVWQQGGAALSPAGRSQGVGIKFRFLEQRDRQQIFKLVSQHIKARLEREGEPRPRPDAAEEPRAPESMAFSTASARASASATPLVPPDAPVGNADSASPAADYADEIRADETLRIDPAVLESDSDSEPSLFDRWQSSEAAAEPAVAGDVERSPSGIDRGRLADTEPVVAPPAAFTPTDESAASPAWDRDASDGAESGVAWNDTEGDLGSSETITPLPATRPRRPRRGGDRSWLIAALLTVAVAAGAAYLLRDRLFGGLVSPTPAVSSEEASATIDDAATDEGAVDPRETRGDGGQQSSAGASDSSSTDDSRPSRDASAARQPNGTRSTPPASTLTASDPPTSTRPVSASPPPSIVPPSTVPPSTVPSNRTPPAGGSGDDRRDVPAEPLPVTPPSAGTPSAGTPSRSTPPRSTASAAASMLQDIAWARRGDQIVVTLTLDGTLPEQRLRRFRLGGDTPRDVVVLVGMDGPFRRSQIEVGSGGLTSIRTGFHRKSRGDEIHVVLDLAGADGSIAEVRNLGDRIELVVDS